ncbi:hypothetical protein NUACC26_018800 [Scytonema sp. NUACC26]
MLAIAALQGRIIVTHDRKTMPIEFGEFIMSQISSGVLIIPQNMPISDVIEGLLLIWGASNTEEWINQIMSLPL